MWSKRDGLFFLAGFMACDALIVHLTMFLSKMLPLTIWGITVTNTLNAIGLIASTTITIALLLWASRTK